MNRTIYYNEQEIENYFKFIQKSEVIFKKKINEEVIFFVVNRIPKNKLPNWIFYAFRYTKIINYQKYFYWRLFSPNELHINGIRDSYDLFFQYYDQDNKNKRIEPRYDGDKNVI